MPTGLYCRSCRGVRLHVPEVRPAAAGPAAVLVCSACDRTRPLPGLHCPACLGRTFSVTATRVTRPGAIVRVRVCRRPGCGRRVRTAERVESVAA